MKLITLNINDIKALCAKYQVKSLFAFGSITRDELKPNSDIDLVVDDVEFVHGLDQSKEDGLRLLGEKVLPALSSEKQ